MSVSIYKSSTPLVENDPYPALEAGSYKFIKSVDAYKLSEVLSEVDLGDIVVWNETRQSSQDLLAYILTSEGFEKMYDIHGGIYLRHG